MCHLFIGDDDLGTVDLLQVKLSALGSVGSCLGIQVPHQLQRSRLHKLLTGLHGNLMKTGAPVHAYACVTAGPAGRDFPKEADAPGFLRNGVFGA